MSMNSDKYSPCKVALPDFPLAGSSQLGNSVGPAHKEATDAADQTDKQHGRYQLAVISRFSVITRKKSTWGLLKKFHTPRRLAENWRYLANVTTRAWEQDFRIW